MLKFMLVYRTPGVLETRVYLCVLRKKQWLLALTFVLADVASDWYFKEVLTTVLRPVMSR